MNGWVASHEIQILFVQLNIQDRLIQRLKPPLVWSQLLAVSNGTVETSA